MVRQNDILTVLRASGGETMTFAEIIDGLREIDPEYYHGEITKAMIGTKLRRLLAWGYRLEIQYRDLDRSGRSIGYVTWREGSE